MKKWIKEFDKHLFAHRGYHKGKEIPENSLAAFARAKEAGFGSELDVHLLKDGELAVLHDSELERMTGRKGLIEELTRKELKDYRLGESEETIPTLREVLDLYDGAFPLIIELKVYQHNAKKLCEKVCALLEGYQGVYCIESFHPQVLLWLKKHKPGIIRGQLSQDFVKSREELPMPLAFLATHMLENLITKPDFVAYKYEDRQSFGNRFAVKSIGRRAAFWTIRSKKELEDCRRQEIWPIFENFEP
jgi:glycerophosphoryl diester phosphodiesterase